MDGSIKRTKAIKEGNCQECKFISYEEQSGLRAGGPPGAMSCIIWNCRGLGNPSTVKELCDLAKKFGPSILCVLETQVHKSHVEVLKSTLGFDNAFAVSSSGRSGGLGIFWNNDKKIEFLPYSQYHIDAIVSEAGGDPWRLTCVYGEAQVSETFKTWDLLKHIKSSSPLPWLCIGDFNEVLHRSEHSGVQERIYTQIAGFREMVDVCGLYDLGYEGRSWTYEKKVAGGSFCRVHLDRALASPDWCGRFPLSTVRHLSAEASDHRPILLHWNQELERRHLKGKSRFQYEVMWETHEEFRPWLANVWQGEKVLTLNDLNRKLSEAAGRLAGWGKQMFGHVRLELQKLKEELDKLQSDPHRSGPSHAEIKITDKIIELNHREEIMWQQRSRING